MSKKLHLHLDADTSSKALYNALLERGLWVPAIRPPTVPRGSARLRVSLTAAHNSGQVARLIDALRELA